MMDKTESLLGTIIMDTKLYLTIAAIIALLYTFAFLLIPEGMSEAFSGFVEPHATLNLRFLGGQT
jgi:hypothetical protein